MKNGRELKLSTCEKDEKVNIKIPKDMADLGFFSCCTCVSLGKSSTPLTWRYHCTSEKF